MSEASPSAGPDRAAPPAKTVAPTDEPDSADEGAVVGLEPAGNCTWCGHVMSVARVVKVDEGSFRYACLGCAVKAG